MTNTRFLPTEVKIDCTAELTMAELEGEISTALHSSEILVHNPSTKMT